MAREVGEMNEQALQWDESRVADLFAQFQRRLQIITAFPLDRRIHFPSSGWANSA
jgi:hypothetical protein